MVISNNKKRTKHLRKQARKTAKVSALSLELARFGLNENQTALFFSLSKNDQVLLLAENQNVVKLR